MLGKSVIGASYRAVIPARAGRPALIGGFVRTLYLLRHAKARREREVSDRDRQLHRKGIRQGAALAAYLAPLGKPLDLVLCSPSRRTRDTLALVLPALPNLPDIEFRDELYLASPDTLLKVVRGAGEGVRSLMLVGHNDGIHQFALALAGGDDLPRLAGFPTGALALFEFEIGSWRELRPRTGRLAAYVDPDELVGAT
jgi:phosphohistidine phosphatase